MSYDDPRFVLAPSLPPAGRHSSASLWFLPLMKTLLRALLPAVLLCTARAAPVHLVDEAPVTITTVAPGVVLVDFGRVAFGNLRFTPPAGATATVTTHFGEALSAGRIHRKPPGTVRYAAATVTLAGQKPVVVAPAPDARNTRQVPPGEKPDQFGHVTPSAVLTPAAWGVVLPFRWVEIEGWSGELLPAQVRRQSAFATTWDDSAASFRSSDPLYNRIWDLCRYSIKATTFAGVYVDGDRERIPYEADAYLNQLSHYTTDRDIQMARDTYDHLMANATWPTEWATHLIFMVHADWMHTGDAAWVAPRYAALKSKLLLERARADGLITSTPAHIKKGDLVDWPVTERDGFVFTPVNTVANAFYLRGLALMADLARVLQHDADAKDYAARERTARAAFQAKLFDPTRGVYRDGELGGLIMFDRLSPILCECHVYFKRSFWGWATTVPALRLAYAWATGPGGYKKGTSPVFESNRLMVRLLEHLGAVQEGFFRNHTTQRGKPVNVLYFSIFKE